MIQQPQLNAVDDGTVMAIAHREFDVKGVQFHPETIMTAFGKRVSLTNR
ncbi:MAG: hypothetical protein QME52_03065 [Bacteroidota bacterium]|nr:hypothetical protein [Bacteroidota bacterium]